MTTPLLLLTAGLVLLASCTIEVTPTPPSLAGISVSITPTPSPVAPSAPGPTPTRIAARQPATDALTTTAAAPAATPPSTPAPVPNEDGPRLLVTSTRFASGTSGIVEVRLLDALTGLSGFDLTIVIEDEAVGVFTGAELSAFGLGTVSDLPSASIRLRAVDLNQVAEPGIGPILLASLTVAGSLPGETVITIWKYTVDDDAGTRLPLFVSSAALTID